MLSLCFGSSTSWGLRLNTHQHWYISDRLFKKLDYVQEKNNFFSFLLHKIALCKPGSYSPTGLEPCIQCEKGFYQETEGQRLCIKCGVNTTTPEEGSNSSMLCAGKNHSVHFMNKQNAQTKLLNVQKCISRVKYSLKCIICEPRDKCLM